MPIVRARVRGVYATALTNLLLKHGVQIVQASRVISTRFNIPQLPLPADVTVKNSDNDPNELLVIGYPWAVSQIESILVDTLPYSFYWRSKLPVHATIRARITGKEGDHCIAELNGTRVKIVDIAECKEGETLTLSTIRTAVREDETPIARPGAKIVGDYAMVYRSTEPRTTLSEHIRSPSKRAELLALAAQYTEKGVSIHWRSSAQHADRETLEKHLRELVAKLEQLEESIRDKPPGVYSEGEDVLVVRLSSVDKQVLDDYRSEITPTTPYHHILKSQEDSELSTICEFADTIMETDPAAKHVLEKSIPKYIASKLADKRRIRILHVKPDGQVIRLGEPEIKNIYYDDGELQLVLVRRVRTPGVYDGLGVEKEPGDIIETTVRTGQWTIEHRYYDRTMELKGVYININTPPEVSLSTITYLDLSIDVVKKPGEKPQVVDIEELKHYHEKGVITRKTVERVLEVLRELVPPEVAEQAAEKLGINMREGGAGGGI